MVSCHNITTHITFHISLHSLSSTPRTQTLETLIAVRLLHSMFAKLHLTTLSRFLCSSQRNTSFWIMYPSTVTIASQPLWKHFTNLVIAQSGRGSKMFINACLVNRP